MSQLSNDTLQIETTPVFITNYNDYSNKKYRYLINQGGSRSSKTYSILQLIIVICLKETKKVSIVRQSFPSLRSSVMRDFFEILKEMDLYDESQHQKTEHVYKFKSGSTVEFFSTDSEQKIRGRKRDILYCNEGNELSFDIFNQLVLRTSGKVIIDFNPSDSDHWIYELIKQENAILIKSNYKDNTFLEQDQIDYIENLINVDENYYKIYALGERPTSEARIFTHFKQYYDEVESSDMSYGLDIGYNHATALVESRFIGNKVYCKELIYDNKLTTSDLLTKVKELNIDRSKCIYVDSARPDIIEDLRRSGYRTDGAKKDVKLGIDKVKSMEVFIHSESVNLWREYRLYSWKTDKDRILDEPIKLNDDAIDALRYSVFSHLKSNKGIPFAITGKKSF